MKFFDCLEYQSTSLNTGGVFINSNLLTYFTGTYLVTSTAMIFQYFFDPL